MTESPRLTLVDRAMQGVEPMVSQAADRKVLARYIGSISKTCYAEERRRVLSEIGATAIGEFAQVPILRAERDARITIDEERKHGKAEYWRGFTIGGMICGAIVGTALALYAAAIINPAFDAAGRIRAQSDMTQALVNSQQEPQAQPYVNPGQDVTRRP